MCVVYVGEQWTIRSFEDLEDWQNGISWMQSSCYCKGTPRLDGFEPRSHAILKVGAAEARNTVTPAPRLPPETTQNPHRELLACPLSSEWYLTSLPALSRDRKTERPPILGLLACIPSTPHTRTWLAWILCAPSGCPDLLLWGPPSPSARSLHQQPAFLVTLVQWLKLKQEVHQIMPQDGNAKNGKLDGIQH